MLDTYTERSAQIAWSNKIYRALIVNVPYAPAPENEGGCLVLRIDPGHVWLDRDIIAPEIVYGPGSFGVEFLDDETRRHIDEIQELLITICQEHPSTRIEYFADEIERRFDGQVKAYGPNNITDYTYVAVNTRQMRKFWYGNAPVPSREECPELYTAELDEIERWLEGDTYDVMVQTAYDVQIEKTSTHRGTGEVVTTSIQEEAWEDIDHTGTIYGMENARQEALALRDHCEQMIARKNDKTAEQRS